MNFKYFLVGAFIGALLMALMLLDDCQRRERAALRKELRRQESKGELDDDQLIDTAKLTSEDWRKHRKGAS